MEYVLGKVCHGDSRSHYYAYWDGKAWVAEMELAKIYEGLGAAQGARKGLKGGKDEIDILEYNEGRR